MSVWFWITAVAGLFPLGIRWFLYALLNKPDEFLHEGASDLYWYAILMCIGNLSDQLNGQKNIGKAANAALTAACGFLMIGCAVLFTLQLVVPRTELSLSALFQMGGLWAAATFIVSFAFRLYIRYGT
jgi:hypothetical protein